MSADPLHVTVNANVIERGRSRRCRIPPLDPCGNLDLDRQLRCHGRSGRRTEPGGGCSKVFGVATRIQEKAKYCVVGNALPSAKINLMPCKRCMIGGGPVVDENLLFAFGLRAG